MSVAESVNVIPANEYADIVVDFEAPDESTHYSKRIILQTYNAEMRYISLRVNADVDLPLKAEPEVIDAGDVSPGKEVELRAVICNRSKKDIKLAYATSSDAGCIAQIPSEAVPAEGKLTVPVKLTAGKDAGLHQSTIKIHTGLEAQKTLNITVKYNVVINNIATENITISKSGKNADDK